MSASTNKRKTRKSSPSSSAAIPVKKAKQSSSSSAAPPQADNNPAEEGEIIDFEQFDKFRNVNNKRKKSASTSSAKKSKQVEPPNFAASGAYNSMSENSSTESPSDTEDNEADLVRLHTLKNKVQSGATAPQPLEMKIFPQTPISSNNPINIKSTEQSAQTPHTESSNANQSSGLVPRSVVLPSSLIAASLNDSRLIAPVICLKYRYSGYCKMKSRCPFFHENVFFVKPINYTAIQIQALTNSTETNPNIDNNSVELNLSSTTNQAALPQTPSHSQSNSNFLLTPSASSSANSTTTLTSQQMQYAAKSVPTGYLCRRCNTAGHFIQLCPTLLTPPQQQALQQYQAEFPPGTPLTPNTANSTATTLTPLQLQYAARTVPSAYLCKKCSKDGHFIQLCPEFLTPAQQSALEQHLAQLQQQEALPILSSDINNFISIPTL
jgi:hypothetical protein